MLDLSKIRAALDEFDAADTSRELDQADESLRLACDKDTIAAMVRLIDELEEFVDESY